MFNYFRQMRARGLMLFLARLSLAILCIEPLIWVLGAGVHHGHAAYVLAMSPLTAVMMTGLCVSFISLIHGRKGASRCVSSAVLITALIKLGGFFGGAFRQTDQYLFTSIWNSDLVAPNTALDAMLLSISLLVADCHKRKWVVLFQCMCTLAFAIALLAVLGHLYSSISLYEPSRSHSPMSAQAALAFLFLSYGVLLLQRKTGFVAELISRSVGGTIARILIPLAMIIPGMLGWLRMEGQNLGLYDRDFGIALLVISIIIFAEVAILYQTYRLNKSDRKRELANMEMLAAKEKAERAARVKDSFLANMSHEIRTPLNSIIGFSELLDERMDDPKLKRYVDNIRLSGRGLLSIVNEILDLAKLETASVELENEPFRLADTMDYITNSMIPLLVDKPDVAFRCDIGAGVPEYLIGDGFRLGQILINITNNSIKFTPKGRVQLDVAQVERYKDRVALKFTLSDTGIGVAADKIESLFKPYMQGELSVTRRFGGTGLGLSIVKHLVELFRGEIEVTSKLGEGTTFTIKLALPVAERMQPPKGATATAPLTEELLARLAGKNILVAEDHPANQQLYVEMFESLPCNMVLANNGKEAIDKLKHYLFDLVLMDLQMPEMDGIEATKAIRSSNGRYKDIPILAVTANIVSSDLQACLDSGMNGWILKPIQKAEMVTKMIALVSGVELYRSGLPLPIAENKTGAPLFDPSYIKEITGDVPDKIAPLTEVLLKDLKMVMQETGEQMDRKDYRAASQSLHKLKNTMGILRAARLLEQVADAEKLARDSAGTELEQIWREISPVLEKLLTEVTAWHNENLRLHTHEHKVPTLYN